MLDWDAGELGDAATAAAGPPARFIRPTCARRRAARRRHGAAHRRPLPDAAGRPAGAAAPDRGCGAGAADPARVRSRAAAGAAWSAGCRRLGSGRRASIAGPRCGRCRWHAFALLETAWASPAPSSPAGERHRLPNVLVVARRRSRRRRRVTCGRCSCRSLRPPSCRAWCPPAPRTVLPPPRQPPGPDGTGCPGSRGSPHQAFVRDRPCRRRRLVSGLSGGRPEPLEGHCRPLSDLSRADLPERRERRARAALPRPLGRARRQPRRRPARLLQDNNARQGMHDLDLHGRDRPRPSPRSSTASGHRPGRPRSAGSRPRSPPTSRPSTIAASSSRRSSSSGGSTCCQPAAGCGWVSGRSSPPTPTWTIFTRSSRAMPGRAAPNTMPTPAISAPGCRAPTVSR